MFCPSCGNEALEGQRFCKGCGTNMQVVGDALRRGDDTLGQLRLDMDALKRKATDFAKNVGFDSGSGVQVRSHGPDKVASERPAPPPKPKDWLQYSWQHNLRDGLISLFGGVGFGFVLFYLARVAIESGAIRDLQVVARNNGLERIASLIWLIALIPVLKGIGQLIYAAFFAESIGTITDRLTPMLTPRQQTAPITEGIREPPSVTEQTTQFFEQDQYGQK